MTTYDERMKAAAQDHEGTIDNQLFCLKEYLKSGMYGGIPQESIERYLSDVDLSYEVSAVVYTLIEHVYSLYPDTASHHLIPYVNGALGELRNNRSMFRGLIECKPWK